MAKTCSRCGGLGKIQAYAHINGGTCFKCGGSGKASGSITAKAAKAEKRAKMLAAEKARYDAQQAEEAAANALTSEQLASLPHSMLNHNLTAHRQELTRRYYASGLALDQLDDSFWNQYNLLRCGSRDEFYVVGGYGKDHSHVWIVGEGSAHAYIGDKTIIASVKTMDEVREELRKLGVDKVRGHRVYSMT
jgi:RecJ-like exonuclease